MYLNGTPSVKVVQKYRDSGSVYPCRWSTRFGIYNLEIARTDGNYRKVMAKYANPLVLVLNKWLLLKPTKSEQKDIFELLHRRRKKSTTIFCSQYEFEVWYDQLGGDASPPG